MLKPSDPKKLIAKTLPGIGPACGVPLLPDAKKGKSRKRIPPDLLHKRRAIRRAMVDARHEKNAIEHIVTIPGDGESFHFVIDGRFHPCDLIPAVRRLTHPAAIKRLDITTLSYNQENVSTLCNGLDQGKIGSVLLVPSTYFSQVERPLYEFTKKELEPRGSRVEAGYVHAKLILMELTDGRCLTVEGSGNLRSCKSIEQFVMTCDRGLLEFHRGWIETYLAEKTTYGRRNRKAAPADEGREDSAGDHLDS